MRDFSIIYSAFSPSSNPDVIHGVKHIEKIGLVSLLNNVLRIVTNYNFFSKTPFIKNIGILVCINKSVPITKEDNFVIILRALHKILFYKA